MKRESTYPIRQWLGWWQQHQRRADLALALLVGVITIIGAHIAGRHQPAYRALDALALALLTGESVALAFRRRYAGWVLIAALGITLIYLVLGYPKGANFLPLIIAFFTAATQGHRHLAWAVLIAEFVMFPWVPFLFRNEPAPTSTEMVGLAGWLLVLATIAELSHIRQQRSLRAREETARRRASEERLRIARELHDVLGHTLSLINVQASVSLHLIDTQPEQARVALAVIKDASKDALRELRSVLNVLRQIHEASPRSPSPGLANLGDLVLRASEAGLQVQTAVSGDLTALPASIDAAAFRIVQEALTNVMRHAGQSTSSIQVTCAEGELTLRIENEVSMTTSFHAIDHGQGILGMQERATALGGVVEAGPSPDGGFRVVARLPLDGRPLHSPEAGV